MTHEIVSGVQLLLQKVRHFLWILCHFCWLHVCLGCHRASQMAVNTKESCLWCLDSFKGSGDLYSRRVFQLLAVMARGCPHADKQCHLKCLRIPGPASSCPRRAQVSHNWYPLAKTTDNLGHLKWHRIPVCGQLKWAHISLNLELYLNFNIRWSEPCPLCPY